MNPKTATGKSKEGPNRSNREQCWARCRSRVEVLPGSPDTLTNEFTLSGGGAPTVTVKDSVGVIDSEPFHIGRFEARTTSVSEAPPPPGYTATTACESHNKPLYDVAGGHPPGTTMNRFYFAMYPANEQMKDAVVKLPPGFFGNPAATPRCPISNIQSIPFDSPQ